MKTLVALTAACLLAAASVGCDSGPDPTKQPGFVDTSDPSNVKMGETAPGTKGPKQP